MPDVLGQEINAGDLVLWASSGRQSGFVGNAPLTVIRVSARNVTLARPRPWDAHGTASVPQGSVVVVNRLVHNAP